MSKQLKSINQEKQIFSILEPILQQQIARQDEQGKALHTMFDGMKTMYNEFREDAAEIRQLVQEVRDSVTVTNAECFGLQSAVASRSIGLTKDRYAEGDESFSTTVGKYRRMIWKQMKLNFDVPKYNCIRRMDFESAMSFVAGFKPEDYI